MKRGTDVAAFECKFAQKLAQKPRRVSDVVEVLPHPKVTPGISLWTPFFSCSIESLLQPCACDHQRIHVRYQLSRSVISFLAREGTLRVPIGVLIYEVSSGVVLVIAAARSQLDRLQRRQDPDVSTAWCREVSSDSNISTSHVNDFPHQAAPETGKCELAWLIADVFGNIRTPSFFSAHDHQNDGLETFFKFATGWPWPQGTASVWVCTVVAWAWRRGCDVCGLSSEPQSPAPAPQAKLGRSSGWFDICTLCDPSASGSGWESLYCLCVACYDGPRLPPTYFLQLFPA